MNNSDIYDGHRNFPTFGTEINPKSKLFSSVENGRKIFAFNNLGAKYVVLV